VKERENMDEGLEALGNALRRLPTPLPPPALVSRVRSLAHLELASRADERLNSLVLGFLLFFSWTVGLLSLVAVRFFTGEVLGSIAGSTLQWSVAYFVSAWISGAAVLALLGFHARKERTMA
jgi:hypothetical protein